MENIKLAQRFTLIALNAQDSINMTTIKKVSLHCVAAAVILEAYLDGHFTQTGNELSLQKNLLDEDNTTFYQEAVLEPLFNKKDSISGDLDWWLKKSANLSSKHLKKLEHTITDSLKGISLIEEIPNILGCDLLYVTSGVSIKEYRSSIQEYTNITENIRAEILEDGVVNDEIIFMLWLLRESSCLHDIFSKSELKIVANRMHELSENNSIAKIIFEINIYHGMEIAIKGFLNIKKAAVRTPTGTGVNFVFPILERSQSVFIETQEWFPNSKQRLEAVKDRLNKNGNIYNVISEGDVPIIKIDNIIYEAIPHAMGGKVPVHGVRLRKRII